MDVKKTIAELTSQLSEVTYDSEEENVLLGDSVTSDNVSSQLNIEDIDVLFEPSKLRKISQQPNLPELTYGGKNTTRKKTYSESDISINSSDIEIENVDSSSNEAEEDLPESGNESKTEESNASETEDFQVSSSKHNKNEKTDSVQNCNIYSDASKNISNDLKKGTAIKNQLRIWESLLECRIKLQKGLTACNSFPSLDDLRSQQNSEIKIKLNKCKKNLMELLEKMLGLQEVLLEHSEFKKSDNWSHSGGDEEIKSSESEIEDEDEENEEQPKKKRRKLSDYSVEIKRRHDNFIPLRNAAIQKWNDKTKVSTGKVANSNFSAFDQSTLKQIEQILADKNRLINRTRIKRTENMNYKSDEEIKQKVQDTILDSEIFDDSDFYHKLLRDYIERKSVDITGSSQTERQMIELQKLRSKMKKNIDTKSTKGRKLRYIVLPKLVNFMAPQPYISWNEQAENELFHSLFGKIKLSF